MPSPSTLQGPLQLEVPDVRPSRQRLTCPRCASSVRRRRRTLLQRWLTRDTDLARYHCADADCAWSGLLTRRL